MGDNLLRDCGTIYCYESGTILSHVSAEHDAQVPLNVTLHG